MVRLPKELKGTPDQGERPKEKVHRGRRYTAKAMVDRRDVLEHLRRTRFSSEGCPRAQQDARRIARFLRQQGARRVLGFGSAFTSSRRFTPNSDIDLAVEGLDPGRFFRVSARAATMTDFPLDIVPVESATDSMRSNVLREGVLL